MKYEISNKYKKYFHELCMGPNPAKLLEELLCYCKIPKNSLVLDLGCGRGLTSVIMAKEYGFRTVAADLWTEPTVNKKFFDSEGLSDRQIMPIKVDATALPFADEFFDAVVTTDSYNYFGRDKKYLGEKLLPLVKHGGYIYITVPGMKSDCHDNLPPELLLSWTPEQLDFLHDTDYWRDIIEATDGIEILDISEMESNEECWNDWLECENEYAVGDRLSMNAGAGKYLNFVKIIIRRK